MRNTTLKTLDQAEYSCALCAAGYETDARQHGRGHFHGDPRARKIAAHTPDELSVPDYYRQVFWSTGIDLPADYEKRLEEVTLDAVELPAGERAILSLQLPAEFLIVFEPVTHAAQFIDVKGEPTRERQNLSVVFNNVRAPTGTMELRPGPLRLTLENRSHLRVLRRSGSRATRLHELLGRRKPVLSAKRLLTNQSFRDIYRTDTLAIDARLETISLTFLFTDLKGSTELYERVGDLVAFDLVRAHFNILNEIVASETGAVVKTIGDAVMATFATPIGCRRGDQGARGDAPGSERNARIRACSSRWASRGAVPRGHAQRPAGLFRADRQHRGARAGARGFALDPRDRTGGEHAEASTLLETKGLRPSQHRAMLRGIADEMAVYEIP